jgi:outer membrane protein assembly factor BamB
MSDPTQPHSLATTVRKLDLEEFGNIHGVTVDGDGNLWFGHGDDAHLSCVDPETGRLLRTFPHVRASSGTAWDGSHIWQISGTEILRVEPESGAIVHRIPTPYGRGFAGLAWADGALWLGDYYEHGLIKVAPETGEVLKELVSDRLVTGVEWIDGQLWHGAWERTSDEAGDGGDVGARLQRVDTESGEVLEVVDVESGWMVSGTGLDAEGRLWCGGSSSGGICAVRLG